MQEVKMRLSRLEEIQALVSINTYLHQTINGYGHQDEIRNLTDIYNRIDDKILVLTMSEEFKDYLDSYDELTEKKK